VVNRLVNRLVGTTLLFNTVLRCSWSIGWLKRWWIESVTSKCKYLDLKLI